MFLQRLLQLSLYPIPRHVLPRALEWQQAKRLRGRYSVTKKTFFGDTIIFCWGFDTVILS